jgi:hypothetical protein
MNKEAACSSEMVYQTTRRYMPEDSILQEIY